MKVVRNVFSQLDVESLSFPFAVRRLAAALCLAFAGTAAFGATTYTWNPTGAENWQTAANWTPTRTTPATDDILQFNNGSITTATNVPTQTIGKLQLTSTTIVTLRATNSATLTVSGGPGALSIASGSMLTNSGSSAITINLPTGSSGTIGGLVDYAGGAHKLTAVDASGITFQTGATFVADTGFSSNPFGTVNLNSVVFANGATYVFKSGANPFGAGTPNSVVVFQAGSLFSSQGTGLPSFSGRTYANFEMNASAFDNTATPSTGGGTLTMDNFAVIAGNLNLNLTGIVTVKGNISVASGATLFLNPATPATNGLNLAGSSVQTISGAGTLTFGTNEFITVSSSSTVTLQRDIGIFNALTNNGVLNCGPNNITSTGLVAVASTGTLTGSGTISPTLILSGTISPGASPGTINTTNETWNGGGHYTWEINKVDSTEGADPGWDLINDTGGLTINANSGNKFNIDITSLTLGDVAGNVAVFDNTATYTWRILKTSTGITGFDPAAFNLNTAGFSNPLGTGYFRIETANTDKDLVLRFVHPPAITCPTNVAVQCAAGVPAGATDVNGFLAQGGTIGSDCTPITSVSSMDATTPGSCPNKYTITRTYTVMDSCGKSANCDQTITVNDTTPPVFTNCPSDINIGCNPGTIPGCDPTVGAVDNCGGGANVICGSTDATNGCSRTRTIIYTATDNCNNSASCTQVVSWAENTVLPMISCPSDTVAECGKTGTNITGTATATDNCNGTPVITFSDSTAPGTCPTNTIITRTFKATDSCTNVATCVQMIYAVDTTPPVFTNCPASTNLGCNPNPLNIPGCDGNVGATDACSTVTMYCASVDAANGCLNYRTNTYTAVDACNNTNICTQVVTWTVDTNAPVFTNCPASLYLGCNPGTIPGCDPAVGASDDCGVTNISCGSVDGPVIGCVHYRTNTYTALDGCSNSATCIQVVSWTADTNAPVFTNCPAGGYLGCNPPTIPGCDPAVGASDNCGVTNISCASVDGTNGCLHTRTITYTAVDGCNNSNSCTQVLTWTEIQSTQAAAQDNGDFPAYTPQPDHNWSVNNGGFGYNLWTPLTDTGGGGTFMEGVGVNGRQVEGNYSFALYGGSGSYDISRALTSSIIAGQFSILMRFDLAGVGGNLVNLRAGNNTTAFGGGELLSFGIVNGNQLSYTDGSGFHLLASGEARGPVWSLSVNFDAATGTYSASVTNLGGGYGTTFSGNLKLSATSVGSFAVINSSGSAGANQNLIFDVPSFTRTGPSITCPADTVAECGQTGTNVTGVASATGNCSVVVTYSDSVAPGTCPTNSIITRTWKATDACSNMVSCVQTIYVKDTTPPVISGCPTNAIDLGCNPPATPNCAAAKSVVTVSDVCDPNPTLDCVAGAILTNGCIRTQSFNLTASDACTNQSNCVVTYTWRVDNIVFTPQPFVCNSTADLGCNPDPATIIACHANIHAASDCGGALVSCQLIQTTNLASCVKTRVIIYTASDGCATAICAATNTWTDNKLAPVFTNPPPTSTTSLGCNPTSIPGANPAIGATNICPTGTRSTITVTTNDTVAGCVHTRKLNYTATDPCGNTKTVTATYSWTVDNTAPTFTLCPTNVNLGCNPTNIPVCDTSTNTVIAIDDCTITNLSCSSVDTTNVCVRTRTFTYTAKDECGNTGTCTYTATWTVNTNVPTLSGCPSQTTLALGCNPPNIPTCSTYNVTANDPCGATVTCTSVDTTNGCAHTRLLTWSATDGCQQSTNCHQMITWTEDTTPPTMTNCPAPTLNLGCNPQTVPVCTSYRVGATDNCSAITTCSSSLTMSNGCQRIRILTYVAKDGCGNSNSCQQQITWTEDTTAPTFTNCPSPTLNLGCNPTDPIPTCASYNVGATDDCNVVTVTCSSVETNNGCLHTRTLTWSAVDGCMNSNTCSQIITWTTDSTGPVITNCPASTLALACNPTNIPTCATYNVGATDDCSTVTILCGSVETNNGCLFTRTLTWTAYDGCSNSSTCSQVITWTNTTGPVLSGCPVPTTLPLGCNPANIPTCSSYNVTASDNCGATVTCNSVDTTNGCTHTRKLTWTAVDGCNKTNSCSQTITWTEDTTPPVLTNCPAPTLDIGCNPQTVPVCTSYRVGATDNCGALVTCSSSLTMSNGCQRIRILTYVAKDGCNNSNSCQQQVTWTEDTTPPTFTNCPAPTLNLGCNPTSAIPTCASYNVGATDDCTTVTVTCGSVDGTNGCVRTRTLTWTAVDACLNTNTCQQVITWTTDSTAPVFTKCPTNTNIGCNPANLPGCDLSTNTVTVIDDCTVTNLSCNFVDGTNNCVRTRTFTYTAQDECGNSSQCMYTVSWTVDTAGPSLSGCPSQTTVPLGCNPNPTNIPTCSSYNVTVADNCGATVSCNSVDTTNGCTHTRTLTWTATDGCNHSTNCHQTITWTEDTTPPVMTNCPAPTLDIGCNPQSVPVCTSYRVGATDNCSSITTCSSSLTMSNGCQRIRILTYVAKDPCGNSNSCQQQITWIENTTPPTITCPSNVTVDCGSSLDPYVNTNLGLASSSGACPGVTTTNTYTDVATNGICPRVITRTWKATDSCGNTSTCDQLITLHDTTPPVFSGCPTNINLGCNPPVGTPNCAFAKSSVTITDSCDPNPTVDCVAGAILTNGCIRTQSFTLTATDGCTNQSNCTVTFTWKVDNIVFTPQPFVCGSSQDLGCNPDPATIISCHQNIHATSDCGGALVSCQLIQTTNLATCVKTRVIIYTASDGCATAICAATNTWTDNKLAPVFTNPPPTSTTSLGCNPASIPGANPNIGATNICPTGTRSTITVTTNDTVSGCVYTRKINYTATDPCGNTKTVTATYSWTIDPNPPVFIKCPTNTDLGCNPTNVPVCDTSTNNVIVTGCSPVLTCFQSADVTNGCTRSRTFIYTATSACTNISRCTNTVTWKVVSAPVFSICPTNVDLGTNPPPMSIPDCDTSPGNVAAADECGPVSITCVKTDSTNGLCTHTRTFVYTATGSCGQTSTCTNSVTWTGTDLPIIHVVVQGGNVVISWAITCHDYVLEHTPSLNPASWTPVSLPPYPVVGGNYQVTIPITSTYTFYRLRFP